MTSNENDQAGSMKGLRICAFESRMAGEMRALLERHGAQVTVAPSMREVPLDENPAAFAFAEKLFAGAVDVVILLTGVGTRALEQALATQYERGVFLEALQKCTIVVRGPKPAAVLREWSVRIDHQVPEPNTWRELLALIDEKIAVSGRCVAVQEYGQPNPELYSGLAERGALVVRVPVYRWALPEDTAPLRTAVAGVAAGEFDILVFTSANQLHNVLAIAEQEHGRLKWLAAARRCAIACIGPTAAETLEAAGLNVDLMPQHPKMGHLVRELAEKGRDLVATVRAE